MGLKATKPFTDVDGIPTKAQARQVVTTFNAYCPARLRFLLDAPPVDENTRQKHTWNPLDCSRHAFLSGDAMTTFQRYPIAQSTDCVRGKVGYATGIHVWEIQWPIRHRGTHAVVGVGTENAPIRQQGYHPLIGMNDESWGWDLGRNRLYHDANNNSVSCYPKLMSPTSVSSSSSQVKVVVPEVFRVVLDMDAGTLSFMVDGQHLGTAFTGLKGKCLYPMVSAVWGNCQVTLSYIGGLEPEPVRLADLCRYVTRQQLRDHTHEVEQLPLPAPLQRFLLHQAMWDSTTPTQS